FFDMRLRRFLMTEPIGSTSLFVDCCAGYRDRRGAPGAISAGGRRANHGARRAPIGSIIAGSRVPGSNAPHPPPCAQRGERPEGDLPGVVEGRVQVRLDRALVDAEGTADTHRRQLAGMDQAVHGHLRHPHDLGDLGHRQKRPVHGIRHYRFLSNALRALQASPPAETVNTRLLPKPYRYRWCQCDTRARMGQPLLLVLVRPEGIVRPVPRLHLRKPSREAGRVEFGRIRPGWSARGAARTEPLPQISYPPWLYDGPAWVTCPPGAPSTRTCRGRRASRG